VLFLCYVVYVSSFGRKEKITGEKKTIEEQHIGINKLEVIIRTAKYSEFIRLPWGDDLPQLCNYRSTHVSELMDCIDDYMKVMECNLKGTASYVTCRGCKYNRSLSMLQIFFTDCKGTVTLTVSLKLFEYSMNSDFWEHIWGGRSCELGSYSSLYFLSEQNKKKIRLLWYCKNKIISTSNTLIIIVDRSRLHVSTINIDVFDVLIILFLLLL